MVSAGIIFTDKVVRFTANGGVFIEKREEEEEEPMLAMERYMCKARLVAVLSPLNRKLSFPAFPFLDAAAI